MTITKIWSWSTLAQIEAHQTPTTKECKATAFGVGGWLWPDTAGEGPCFFFFEASQNMEEALTDVLEKEHDLPNLWF